MIKLENSEKAISGLAKLIAQDPTYPARLRNAQKEILDYGGIKEDKKYFQEQEEILQKAEKIGLANTGYIFNIDYNNEEYMLYKKVENEMIVLSDGIGISAEKVIKGFDDLQNYLEKFKIKNLVSFEPSDQDSFYSQPWTEGETDEDFKWGHGAQHCEANFDDIQLKILNEKKINFEVLDERDAYEFNLKLKDLNS